MTLAKHPAPAGLFVIARANRDRNPCYVLRWDDDR